MNITIDMLNEVSTYLDLKSIINLYATTLAMTQLCDKMYWKKLYHLCYSSQYYKSKDFTLSQYKYKNSTDDTLILHRKYTDREYVMIYYAVHQLSKKINRDLNINQSLILQRENINTFYPEFSKIFIYKVLDLHGNPLNVIPPSIGNMTNLKELCLSNTNISKLPNEIGLLVKLKTVSIYQNNISELPKEIGLLTNLSYLDCSHNLLNSLPQEITCMTKLKRLYLENNQLTSLPNMTSLINLKDMSLANNLLSSKDIITITSSKLNQSTRHMLNSL